MKKTFLNSLGRNRKEFSEARAVMLATDASEARHDIVREVNKEIRGLEMKLMSIENNAYEDDVIIAFKKGRDINVRKDLVEARYDTLLDLRTLYIKRRIIERDTYFKVPEEMITSEKGTFEDLLVTDEELAELGEHPVVDGNNTTED